MTDKLAKFTITENEPLNASFSLKEENIQVNFKVEENEPLQANFRLVENEPLQANFSVNNEPLKASFVVDITPTKISELENDVGYITVDEVPDGMTDEQKQRLSNLNVQYKEVIVPTQDLDLSTVFVDDCGSEYGFSYNAERNSIFPQNSGIDESYSYGKITFDVVVDTTIEVSFFQWAESYYDYGLISELDTSLDFGTEEEYTKWNGREYGEISDTIIYEVPAGSHFITFKYIKDISYGEGDDCFEITNIKINGFETRKLINYDTGEEINLKTDLSDYYTKNEVNKLIPRNLSSFNNDVGYITKSAIPTVPTKTSQLTNDSNFTTKTYVDGLVGNVESLLKNINSGS